MLRFLTKSARPRPEARPPTARRISVVIPSYNHAPYIAQAIRSVLDQDRPVDELIIVDDCSTDESRAVIARTIEGYAGPVRIQCALLDRNGGAHAAIALGLSKASGDALTILNSDDAYGPDRFRVICDALPPEGDFIAFTGVDFMDDSGARLAEDDPVRTWYRDVLGQAGACPTVGFALLRHNIAVTSGNLVFSRGLYETVGPFAAYRMCHDWDFLIRCMVHVEPVFVPTPHLRYRTHATNTLKSTGDLMHGEGSAALKTYLSLIARGRRTTGWHRRPRTGRSTSGSSPRPMRRGSPASRSKPSPGSSFRTRRRSPPGCRRRPGRRAASAPPPPPYRTPWRCAASSDC